VGKWTVQALAAVPWMRRGMRCAKPEIIMIMIKM
jgi:hypothetical protein